MDSSVESEIYSDGIMILRLNRPDKLNAFTREMIALWKAALEQAADDDDVRAVILTGKGRGFCAGADLGKARQFGAAPTMRESVSHVQQIPLLLERFDKPIIAAINGVARGAGLDMALMCDIRIAAKSATLAESYIDLGLIAGDGGTYFLPRLVGIDRALELFWTGDVVSADDAAAMGMVSRVVDDADLIPEALRLARKIAAKSPAAIRMFKRAVYQSMHSQLGAHLDMVGSHMGILAEMPEHSALVAAFLNRKSARA